MSRPRFLADQDLSEFIIDGVARRDPLIEFLRLREVGQRNWPEAAVLEYAAKQGLLLVSQDVNTMPLHAYARIAAGHPMSGLLLAPQLAPVSSIIESLGLIWSASDADEWRGAVTHLPV